MMRKVNGSRPACILAGYHAGETLYLPQSRAQSSFWIVARPAKAGMFSGSQSHQGKSQSPVTWVASVEETKRMKPTDKAIFRMVSESPGRNASEPSGGLDKKINPGGRAFYCQAKAA